MKNGVTPETLQRWRRRIDLAKANIHTAAWEEIVRSSGDIAELARRNAPRGTGALAAAIDWEMEETNDNITSTIGVINPPLRYAKFVHARVPFLASAYDYHEPIFRQSLRFRIAKELRRIRSIL